MSIVKVAPRGFDLTDTYAFTGTVSGVNAGSMVKISSQTASASSSISFTGIDSTYRTYCFKFINIHPQTGNLEFDFQGTTDGTNYNTTMTTTTFSAFHNEADSSATLSYASGRDQAQGTSFQALSHDIKADNDSSLSGELWLFNPSSTTYVKHWISDTNYMQNGDASQRAICAGYFNTTSAITGIRFQMESGNIDAGTIALYGIA